MKQQTPSRSRPYVKVSKAIAVASVLVSLGCVERGAEGDAAGDAEGRVVSSGASDAAHDKSHDHEHFVAAHRPPHFPAAVRSLKRMAKRVGEELREGHREHAREALDELCDVLTWLPEIAADSDLPEKEWLSVSQEAKTLLKRCEGLKRELNASQCAAIETEVEQTHRRWERLVADRRDWFPEAFPVKEDHD